MNNLARASSAAARIRVHELLDLALRASRLAGSEILKTYANREMRITRKLDGSPVTDADLRSHDVIRECLQSSDVPTLSEEAAIPFDERSGWDRFWLVDPLDGTKDFIAENGEFAVNIALIEQGFAVIGVIVAPALQQTWYASRGEGAWEVNGDVKRPINALEPWPSNPRMFVSRFHDVPGSREFGQLNRVGQYIPLGASLKMAKIAASEAEFYPRFAGTSEWDTAAADAILREAGGMLRTITGDLPCYNKPSLRNPYSVTWRPPMRWEDIRLPAQFGGAALSEDTGRQT